MKRVGDARPSRSGKPGRDGSCQPTRSPYITREGFQALQSETEQLWHRRAAVTKALAAAAAEGDRSENAEYIYRKKELREIDRRIRYLQKRLPDLRVVSEQPAERARIFFGAWVKLDDGSGRPVVYRIVGADEIGLGQGYISVDSPVARALMKKTVGDPVRVRAPGGEVRYRVVDVAYAPFGD